MRNLQVVFVLSVPGLRCRAATTARAKPARSVSFFYDLHPFEDAQTNQASHDERFYALHDGEADYSFCKSRVKVQHGPAPSGSDQAQAGRTLTGWPSAKRTKTTSSAWHRTHFIICAGEPDSSPVWVGSGLRRVARLDRAPASDGAHSGATFVAHSRCQTARRSYHDRRGASPPRAREFRNMQRKFF
jgi:hypothetical protein